MLNAFHILHRARLKGGAMKWLKRPYRLQYTMPESHLQSGELFEKLKQFAEYKDGVYTFTVRPEDCGYLKVSAFCEVHGLSRQHVWEQSHKYEWISVSRNVNFLKCK